MSKSDVNTRGNVKMFKLMTKCSGKYLGSPLYRGSILWEKLEKATQDLPNARHFSNVLTKKCRVYKDLLH